MFRIENGPMRKLILVNMIFLQNPEQCYYEMRAAINGYSLGFTGLAAVAMLANFLQA
jgi:hypothetical protein